ncbi:MAG: ABC transporter substrate-binding protein [Ancrocorticia sp.]
MRRTITLKGLAAAASTVALLTLAGCSNGGASSDGAEVNIIAYSGVWEEQYRKAVIDPFQDAHPDIKINYVSKRSSAEMLSALQGQQGKPMTDVSIMDISVSTSGNNQEIFEKLTEEQVPNLARVKDEFRNADGFGPAVNVDAVALLYDTAVVGEAPTSWSILWEPEYKGKVSVVAPPSLLGISLTAIASTMEGEDYMQSIDKATAKLVELAPNISSFAPNPDEYQSIITGQTVFGLGQNGRGQYYADESGGKLGVAFPEEGTAYQINTINLVKDAPNAEAATTFIDYALSAEAQTAFAEALFYAPTVDNATLSDDVASRVVPTDGSLNIIPLDVNFLAANRDAWTDMWKRMVIPASQG